MEPTTQKSRRKIQLNQKIPLRRVQPNTCQAPRDQERGGKSIKLKKNSKNYCKKKAETPVNFNFRELQRTLKRVPLEPKKIDLVIDK
jgi:hypothetical protein